MNAQNKCALAAMPEQEKPRAARCLPPETGPRSGMSEKGGSLGMQPARAKEIRFAGGNAYVGQEPINSLRAAALTDRIHQRGNIAITASKRTGPIRTSPRPKAAVTTLALKLSDAVTCSRSQCTPPKVSKNARTAPPANSSAQAMTVSPRSRLFKRFLFTKVLPFQILRASEEGLYRRDVAGLGR